LKSVDDDTFTGLQTSADEPLIFHQGLEGDRPSFDPAVGADYRCLTCAGRRQELDPGTLIMEI
jgi:hypothetical protein